MTAVPRFAILQALCLLACLCLQATESVSGEGVSILSPREAGARYGQAAGAEIVCYGLKATNRTEELRARYRDADLTEFQTEAAKVLDAWKKTATCENAYGPNPCKLSHVWSCQAALKEIGPEGTAVPGLVATRSEAPAGP